MRRQFGVGRLHPAGSGCTSQPDPLFLPARYNARDGRADDGVRHIELTRERVVVRRAVDGIPMAVNVRIRDFLGIACRNTEDAQVILLVHRDPSLSIPLLVTTDHSAIQQAWDAWLALLALPRIEREIAGDEPACRRRRHNAIKARRPKFLVRRKTATSSSKRRVYRDEREIIARDESSFERSSLESPK